MTDEKCRTILDRERAEALDDLLAAIETRFIAIDAKLEQLGKLFADSLRNARERRAGLFDDDKQPPLPRTPVN